MSCDTPCEKVPSPALDPCPAPLTRAPPAETSPARRNTYLQIRTQRWRTQRFALPSRGFQHHQSRLLAREPSGPIAGERGPGQKDVPAPGSPPKSIESPSRCHSTLISKKSRRLRWIHTVSHPPEPPRQRPLLPVATPTLRSRPSGGEHRGSRSRHADFSTTRVHSWPACCTPQRLAQDHDGTIPSPTDHPFDRHTQYRHTASCILYTSGSCQNLVWGSGFRGMRAFRVNRDRRFCVLFPQQLSSGLRQKSVHHMNHHLLTTFIPEHRLSRRVRSVSACNNLSPQPTRGFSATGFAGKAQLT